MLTAPWAHGSSTACPSTCWRLLPDLPLTPENHGVDRPRMGPSPIPRGSCPVFVPSRLRRRPHRQRPRYAASALFSALTSFPSFWVNEINAAAPPYFLVASPSASLPGSALGGIRDRWPAYSPESRPPSRYSASPPLACQFRPFRPRLSLFAAINTGWAGGNPGTCAPTSPSSAS